MIKRADSILTEGDLASIKHLIAWSEELVLKKHEKGVSHATLADMMVTVGRADVWCERNQGRATKDLAF